jgi:hypothetical protein
MYVRASVCLGHVQAQSFIAAGDRVVVANIWRENKHWNHSATQSLTGMITASTNFVIFYLGYKCWAIDQILFND